MEQGMMKRWTLEVWQRHNLWRILGMKYQIWRSGFILVGIVLCGAYLCRYG